jgi:hypothetical protein
MYQKLFKLAKSVGHFVETTDGEMLYIPKSHLTGQRPNVATLQPRVLSGEAAFKPNNPKSAIDQINALVAEQIARGSTKTKEQLFSQIYSERSDLARQERAESRAALAAVTKAVPQMATNEDVDREDVKDDGEEDESLKKLNALAADLRKREPHLTHAAAFARIYTSKEHSAPAESERKAHRPQGNIPHPLEKRHGGF